MTRRATLLLAALLALGATAAADGFHSPLLRNKDPRRWAETTRKRLGLDKSDTAAEEDGDGDAFRRRAAAAQLTDVLRYLDKKNVLLREFPDFNYDNIPKFKSETETLLIAIGKDAVPLLVSTIIADIKGAAGPPGLSRAGDFQKRVVAILIAIGEDSLPEVVLHLEDDSAEVRAVMLEIVRGVVDGPDFGRDAKLWKRWFSIFHAGRVKDRRAVPRLLESLKDPDYRLRLASVNALGEIGSRDAVPGLVKLLTPKTEQKLLAAACRSVAKIGDPRAAPKLIDLLEHPRLAIRREAATALRFLTREMKGYRAEASEKARAAAVNRWREWWERELLRKVGQRK